MGIFSNGKGDSESNGAKSLPSAEAAAIARASQEIKSSHGGARSGSGRKPAIPGNGRPNLGAAPQGAQKPNQAEVSEADIEFVKTATKSGLRLLRRFEERVITGLIKSIGDKYIEERSQAFLNQVEITAEDETYVSDCTGALAAKYSFLSKYAPEAALLGWATTHTIAFTGVTKELKNLGKVVAAARAKGIKPESANASPSPTN